MTEMITSNQRKQILRFIEDGLDAFPLMKSGAQRVIEQGGKLQKRFRAILEELSTSNDYRDEEVASSYVYPKGYAVKPLAHQIAILMERFDLLGSKALAYAENLPELPKGAEAWFAIPRWVKVASTYNRVLERVFEEIARPPRKFYNHRKGELGSKHLRQSALTMESIAKIGEKQPGDILIVAAQFGMRHRGRSVRRARAVFAANEFGLGAFEVGSMLITHPERLQHYKDLWIDCAGDEYAPFADGDFSNAPYFGFDDGGVKFIMYWIDIPSSNYGSASGFVPQF